MTVVRLVNMALLGMTQIDESMEVIFFLDMLSRDSCKSIE